MKKKYQEFIDVPDDLRRYLSLDLLNQDYWAHCLASNVQQDLEQKARNWLELDFSPYEGEYKVEIKIDDISTEILPIVPKICDQQGFIFIWSVPLEHADSITAAALKFKCEPQGVKSVIPDNCEKLVAQVHIYPNFVFISAVKYLNFIAKYPKEERLAMCKNIWKILIELFRNKDIYAVNGGVLNTAHNMFNNKNIQHEPYRRKVLKQLGFKETLVKFAPPHFYLSPEDKIWKYMPPSNIAKQ
jgi:hypothetical protein